MSEGAKRITAERNRQCQAEGYDAANDDNYTNDELVKAARAYLSAPEYDPSSPLYPEMPAPWPWPAMSFKPSTRIRNLEKAGALIAAEIDRLLRNG